MKTITITYCKPCGYLKRAEAAASSLKAELGIEPKLLSGKGGIFEVAVDGNVVAKRTRDSFPDEKAIVAAVKMVLKTGK